MRFSSLQMIPSKKRKSPHQYLFTYANLFFRWYTTLLKSKKLANSPVEQLSASDVKLRGRVIPRLFGLCWGPYPLHFKADKGWGFLVPRG